MKHIKTLTTTKEEILSPFIRIEKDATISNIWTNGHCKISKGTFIGNSKLDKYFAVGLFSFLQRCICHKYITIGSRVSIGAFSHPTDWLSTLEFQFRDSKMFYGESLESKDFVDASGYIKETVIGNDVWIGDNVFIKSGIKVGDGAIIGAGAVVVKDVEPYAIVGGNPAKIIRHRFNNKITKQLLELKWWRYDIKELGGVKFDDIEKAICDIKKLDMHKKGQDTKIEE